MPPSLMRGWVLVNKNECTAVEVSWRQERDLRKAMVVSVSEWPMCVCIIPRP